MVFKKSSYYIINTYSLCKIMNSIPFHYMYKIYLTTFTPISSLFPPCSHQVPSSFLIITCPFYYLIHLNLLSTYLRKYATLVILSLGLCLTRSSSTLLSPWKGSDFIFHFSMKSHCLHTKFSYPLIHTYFHSGILITFLPTVWGCLSSLHIFAYPQVFDICFLYSRLFDWGWDWISM